MVPGPDRGSLALIEGGAVEEEEGEEEEGKISPMCESIGHRPLRGRCPKTVTNTSLENNTGSRERLTDRRANS